MFKENFIFSEDCVSAAGCDTCPGGKEFTGNDICPEKDICLPFRCENDADCNTPNGKCEPKTNQCVCRQDYLGLDCSLRSGRFFLLLRVANLKLFLYATIFHLN